MEEKSIDLGFQIQINYNLMTEFTSDIKQLPYNENKIFEVLSDMSNLETVKDRISHDKIQDFSFDKDSCSFSFNPVGEVRFNIVEREAPNAIKFVANPSPIDVNMWVRLKEVSPEETEMTLTIETELNPVMKAMVAKPLQDGINKIADILASVPYDEI